jgi:hypothetical protein
MQLRSFNSEAQRTYVHHIAQLARLYDTSPDHLDLEDLREYQLPSDHWPRIVPTFRTRGSHATRRL